MKIKKLIIFIFLIVLISLMNDKLEFAKNKKYEVIGNVAKPVPYMDENLILINRSVPIKGAKVLITAGKIRHVSHSEYINISNIDSSKIYAYTNSSGKFNVELPPGEYTFFLVINDKAYLNSFDNSGNFTSTRINSKVDDLIITDFRDVSFWK